MVAGGVGLLGSWVLWLAASSSSSSNQKDATAPTTTITTSSSWHVCLSPGCVGDGAHATLAKLKALAPPGTQICPGPCESQCGKGPIVTATTVVMNHEGTTVAAVRANANQKKVIYSRMTGDALLDLLLLANNSNKNSGIVPPPYDDEMNPCLLEGYELVEQANEYFRIQQDYKRAIPLYEAGIEMALTPAKEMVQLDEGVLGGPNEDVEKEMWPVGRLEWLVRAYSDCAKAHLAEAAAAANVVEDQKTMSMDRARVLAEAACDLSHRADMDSLEQLAQVHQASNNPAGELNALQSLLDLPEEESSANNVANRRRLLGFRRAKLERELNSSS
eukprot:scaffold4515_cov42-Attheya_sp.AAC.1